MLRMPMPWAKENSGVSQSLPHVASGDPQALKRSRPPCRRERRCIRAPQVGRGQRLKAPHGTAQVGQQLPGLVQPAFRILHPRSTR